MVVDQRRPVLRQNQQPAEVRRIEDTQGHDMERDAAPRRRGVVGPKIEGYAGQRHCYVRHRLLRPNTHRTWLDRRISLVDLSDYRRPGATIVPRRRSQHSETEVD